jgi:hypothetical protein
MNLIPKREPTEVPNVDILRIYDKRDNSIVAESTVASNQDNIGLEHDGLGYLALPNGIILITFESLINKFKKDE